MHCMHVGNTQKINKVSYQCLEKEKIKVGGLIMVHNMKIYYIKYLGNTDVPT